jgi:lipoprotein NlpD
MVRLKQLVILLLFIFSSCSAAQGVVHTVGKGETLWRISYTYGVNMKAVARANHISDPTQIRTGARLFIPGVAKVKKVVPYTGPASVEKNPKRFASDKGVFSWPVRGTLSSRFGMRSGKLHDGIDIRAPRGTSVRAAARGRVVYVSDDFRNYGRIVILKHAKNYYTVYAHNKKNLVRVGQTIPKGKKIAMVGRSGNATGNHLHFEIRNGRKVINPLFFLP